MSLHRLEELEKKISIYDNAYHNLDVSLITDAEYDALVLEYEGLLKLFPQFTPAFVPGFTENKGATIPLTEPMLSIAKVNDWEKLKKNVTRYKSYTTEEKEDGVAIRLIYDETGSIKFLHLKGNGFEGKDISHRKHLITGIPDSIDNDTGKMVSITGEVVCLAEDYNYFKEQASEDPGPERGIVSGFLRRDEAGEDDGDLPMQFIAFHASKVIREKFTTYTELREWLSDNGFELPARLDDIVDTKPESIYPIDGIVIKNNDLSKWNDQAWTGYNSYSVCYKYPTEIATTKVEGAVWNVNAQGYLKGVLTYHPVKLGSIVSTKCSFYYPEVYIRNKLKVGATIEVTRGNEIIPKLVGLVENGEGELITFPDDCPCCQEPLNKEAEGVYRCVNDQCTGQLSVRLKKAVSGFGFEIDGLGVKRLAALIESNVVVFPSQLFTLTLEDLVSSGISKKVAKKVLDEIDEGRKRPLANWIYAAAIPKLGKARCLELNSHFKEFPVNSTEELIALLRSALMTDLFGLDGLGIIAYVINNGSELTEFFNNIDFKQMFQLSTIGISIGITGTCDIERKQLVERLAEHGYWLDNKVSKSTSKLLVGNKPSPGKIGLAERFEIPVVNITGLSFESILQQLEKR